MFVWISRWITVSRVWKIAPRTKTLLEGIRTVLEQVLPSSHDDFPILIVQSDEYTSPVSPNTDSHLSQMTTRISVAYCSYVNTCYLFWHKWSICDLKQCLFPRNICRIFKCKLNYGGRVMNSTRTVTKWTSPKQKALLTDCSLNMM